MDDAPDLIERLLTAAGTLMEDDSPAAILKDTGTQAERIAQVQRSAGDIQTLADAAAVIARRFAV